MTMSKDMQGLHEERLFGLYQYVYFAPLSINSGCRFVIGKDEYGGNNWYRGFLLCAISALCGLLEKEGYATMPDRGKIENEGDLCDDVLDSLKYVIFEHSFERDIFMLKYADNITLFLKERT